MALPLTGSDFICLDALSESHKSINIVIIIILLTVIIIIIIIIIIIFSSLS